MFWFDWHLTKFILLICKVFKIFMGFFEIWNLMKVKESYRKLKQPHLWISCASFFEDVVSYLKYNTYVSNLICFKSKVHNPIRTYTPSQSAPSILVLTTWVNLWPWKKIRSKIWTWKYQVSNNNEPFFAPCFFQVHILDSF